MEGEREVRIKAKIRELTESGYQPRNRSWGRCLLPWCDGCTTHPQKREFWVEDKGSRENQG